ncbi:hypothetical protein N9A56_03535 [Planktomarina temperata]|nr:hypothetical protein [Planktomarina temperata]
MKKMDKSYLMQNENLIKRRKMRKQIATQISDPLQRRLIKLGIEQAINFYSNFFNHTVEKDLNSLVNDYLIVFREAINLGLFQRGGIQEKDHLTLWCLNQVFKPSTYIESGVFIGSSLHAFLGRENLKSVVLIDPDLSKLRVNINQLNEVQLIDDKDFSQLDELFQSATTFAYFDDHIDTASRITKAAELGIKYVMFDDSNTVSGLCQRIYPAVPTLQMITQPELFEVGDILKWSVGGYSYTRAPQFIKSVLSALFSGAYSEQEFCFTEELHNKAQTAKKLMKKLEVVPDLQDYIPQRYPRGSIDTTKYIIELDV